MKSLVYEGPQRISVKDVPVPEIGDDEALVEVEACGLCGTDLVKIYNSSLQPPVPLGHEVAGRIAQVGSRLKGFKKGDRVVVAHHVPCFECHYCKRDSHSMCRDFKRSNLDPGGFSQFVRVTKRHADHTMFKIPQKMDFATASQVEPLACCLRNVRRLKLQKGDVAVVVGLGSIGLMTSHLLLLNGVTVIGFDIDPQRVRIAHKSGIEHAYTGKDGRADEIIMAASHHRGADVLVFTTGSPSLVNERLAWVRDGGIVNIFASFHPESRVPIDLNSIYHRELTLMSSYSPAPNDLRDALQLITDGSIKMEAFTSNTYPLDRFTEAVRQVRGREILKAILLPQKIVNAVAA